MSPAPAARVWTVLLSLLACPTLLGVAFHPWVLYGPDRRCWWAGCATLLAGAVFLARSMVGAAGIGAAGFWDGLRCRLAGLGCLLWGLYLVLFSTHATTWLLDIVFAILAMLAFLGRSRTVFLVASLGVFAVVGIRHAGDDRVVALLDLALLAAVFLGGAHRVDAWLAKAPEAALPAVRPRARGWDAGRAARAAATLAVFAVLAFHGARPTWLMVRPGERRRILEALSPSFPIQDPGTLSPLAARLRGHVTALAAAIGERAAYQPQAQDKAKDYVVARLREAGYAPVVLDYAAGRKTDFMRTAPYRNVEAALDGPDPAGGEGAWVVGAHYDTAPGTPGADDNASGVAVLLEAARLVRGRRPSRPVRFVAFAAEEPPAFSTRDMGSWRYARRLKELGVKVEGVLVLEMLGYFNPRPSSQLFPPFLHLFYPDRGDYVGLASNLSSLGLLRSFLKAWRAASSFPIEGTVLPSVLSTLAVSDQLNFWFAGFPALLLSDTAYFRYPHYHQASDTPDKLDYERMASVTEALVGALAPGSARSRHTP
ncbi:MAG: M28 family peptidase [Elusimicrobia bacterium]|nr:M28 family peptidase [Elusimicrobiota bacterium]